MRNSNIMLKLIADLLEKAMNKIAVEYRAEQLKAVKFELETKTAELASLRETEKGQTYSDEEARQYVEVRKKNIVDLLIPALKDDLETLKAKLDTNDAALESVDRLYLQALERIEVLNSQIEELKKAAEERTGEFQASINDEIVNITSEIGKIELELDTYKEKLAELIIKRAELTANSVYAKKSIIDLESELEGLSKTGKFISFKKVIAKAKEGELAASVDALKKRKRYLETNPEILAKELTASVKNGATEDEIRERLTTLKTLAGEIKIDLSAMPKFGFVAVPSRRTVGELSNQASFYKSSALALQQNFINNTVLISKMVAGIIYYMELINRATIVKAQLLKDLQTFEKEFTKLPGIRANIKKVEETIARLETAKNQMIKALEETVVYNKANAIKQCSSSFMESQAIMGLSQLESKNPNPFAINQENLTIMETLLSEAYQLPIEGNVEEQLGEENNILDGLEGESHTIPISVEQALPAKADLSSVDPNSLTEETVPILPLQPEDQVNEQPAKDLPLSEMMEHEADEKGTEKDNVGLPISTPEKPIFPASVYLSNLPKEPKKANVEPLELVRPVLPVSTPENPIYPASVTEYDRRVNAREIEPEKITVPGSEVVDIRPVTFTEALRTATFAGVQQIGVKRI